MITNNTTKGKHKYPLIIGKTKPRGLSSFPSPSFSSTHDIDNKFNNSRPFKTKSNDLSLKGLSLSKGNSKDVTFKGKLKVAQVVNKYAEDFGKTPAKYFEEKINKAASTKGSGLTINRNGEVEFQHKGPAKRLYESFVIYPFVKMPLDIANSAVKMLKKIKPLKNATWLNNIENNKTLKNRKKEIDIQSKVAAVENYFSLAEKGKSGFRDGHSRLNANVASYGTAEERSLTRIVTGAVTAVFLGTDAYNLSRVLDDDKKLAKKEKKRRFRQELARVGMTGAFTFATMKVLSKEINKSKAAVALTSIAPVLIAETAGRLLAGNPVLPVGEKSAKKYAKKQGKAPQEEQKQIKAPNKNYRDLAAKRHFGNKEAVHTFEAFKGFENSKPEFGKEYKEPPHKGTLTTSNILKVAGGLVAFGFLIEKGTGLKPVKKVLNGINDEIKKLKTTDFEISREDFNRHITKLKDNGFENVANKYQDIVSDQKGETLNLGKKGHKVIDPAMTILSTPFKFFFNTAMLPYKKIVKPTVIGIDKAINPSKYKKPKTGQEFADKAKADAKKEMNLLKDSISFLKELDNKPNKSDDYYKKQVSRSILSSLDNQTKSSHNSAEVAVIAATAARGTSSAFLVADNYNMVMVNSNGQDKDLASQKAKERTIQRASRMTYSTFLMKLFNTTFASLYNKSLLGAQMVNIANATTTEIITRKAIGLPLNESSRKEIVETEQKNLKAEGFKGQYFRFMAKLTGKKPLSQRASVKAQKAQDSKKTA